MAGSPLPCTFFPSILDDVQRRKNELGTVGQRSLGCTDTAIWALIYEGKLPKYLQPGSSLSRVANWPDPVEKRAALDPAACKARAIKPH